ncbi:AfsR/SARP family transcriptional regulator [Nonomuraea solani]|uniref:AfsR/SARP family transcriptional regulator n=1 Tax=Nonomuraea solani TaxID=1144553 RepID=UPI001357ADAD|nr:AfsR/SARP family transcriptional regulator [Nonomuraea solani]
MVVTSEKPRTRRFSLLGTLRLDIGSRQVAVTAGKMKVVLAALLLNENEPVTSDRLIEYMWERPPASARTLLHSVILRLRRITADREFIRTRGSNYVLGVQPGELDLHDLSALLNRADNARAHSDVATEHDCLSRAIELWRGPTLADVPSPALRMGVAARFDEMRLQALDRQNDLDLALGRCAEVVSRLREVTREHPYKERFWKQLMTALYRCGRQGEALGAYHELRRMLGRELGIEPGPDVKAVYQSILRP